MASNQRLRRGIYLLPTLFTVGNLFCGYSSLIYTFRGEVAQAALFIIFAGVLDLLDGRIARMTGTTSDFGSQFDSLADITSFGIAPALLAYHWALGSFGRLGWFIAFLFVVCAAMRLARFNIQASAVERRHFAGLPSPPAAGTLACIAFAFPGTEREEWVSVLLSILTAALALLMVSRLRYRSFKDLDLQHRRPYIYVLPVSVIVVALVIWPKWALLTASGVYLFSAPVSYAWVLLRRGRSTDSPAEASSGEVEVADEPALR